MFDSPQVKRNLISSMVNLAYQLSNDLPNDVTYQFRKLGNIRKSSNLDGHIAQCPVPPKKLDLGNSS